MNDWIIWGLFVLTISEVMFIISRIVTNNKYWFPQKCISIIGGLMIGTMHLLFLIDNTAIGDPIIFHWNRLIYEGYVIVAIELLFLVNYFISKLIEKFALGRGEVTE